MAENTKIEWCDHTFNPWIGCAKVSPGCANCYAENLMDKRLGRVNWGKGKPRSKTRDAEWKKPLRWNKEEICPNGKKPLPGLGLRHGHGPYSTDAAPGPCCECGSALRRPRVFCASLADWLDEEVPVEWLADLLELIRLTPNLDWLLLTKRPQNFQNRLASVAEHLFHTAEDTDQFEWIHDWVVCGKPPVNIWIGTSAEDQDRADERIPELLKIPARVRFLSCEPLLGPLSLKWIHVPGDDSVTLYPLAGKFACEGMNEPKPLKHGGIDWVICGGESGPHARPMNPDWARSLRDQCKSAEIPFFFKQWGEWIRDSAIEEGHEESRLVDYGDGDVRNFRRVYRVGKKKAGRLLDGVEWNQFPK